MADFFSGQVVTSSRGKPHVVVFFGGTADSYDLSQETGYWVCQYAPRSTFRVTPVRVLPDGRWQVPLGSLPQQGSVSSMLRYLFEGVEGVSAQEGLARVLRTPVHAFMTLIRGEGGDDGALHGLAQSLGIPMIGAPLQVCQQTSDKYVTSQLLESVVSSPAMQRFSAQDDPETVVDTIRKAFVPPLFVKPVRQESSVGVEEVGSIDELAVAVKRAQQAGDVLVQQRAPGTEVTVTVVEQGKSMQVLPTTVITPHHTTFYDRLAKRRAGRATLHTPPPGDRNVLLTEAQRIAAESYRTLGAKGVMSFDLHVDKGGAELLEVNAIPTFTRLTPLKQQLHTAGLHPTQLFDSMIREAVS